MVRGRREVRVRKGGGRREVRVRKVREFSVWVYACMTLCVWCKSKFVCVFVYMTLYVIMYVHAFVCVWIITCVWE